MATSWLVYRLTHSALLLGIVGFAGQIVSFALAPVAGVWVERLNRRKLLVWTQAGATEDKRARVMSYWTMAFFGAAPFGSLLAGMLAQRIGAPLTVIVTGAFCVAGSLWFTLELPKVRAVMRPIYQEMGLLQNPAAM